MNGLGMTVDLSLFDQLVNIPRSYVPAVEIFNGPGSVWHIILGAFAGFLPGSFETAAVVGFSGYELSKLAAGESPSNVAGSILEFALGLLLSAGMRYLR